VFFLKVFPMIPSRPIDWITAAPAVERVRYPTSRGQVEGAWAPRSLAPASPR